MKKLLAALLLLPGCSGGDDADPVITPTAFESATLRSVKGRVVFKGEPPKLRKLPIAGNAECAGFHTGDAFDEDVLVRDGKLENAFVYVKEGLDPAWVFDWPRTPLSISNKGCVYVPRIAGVQIHQPIRFLNEDPTTHNIHGFLTGGKDFNFTLYGKGNDRRVKVRETQVMMRVKCDLHPWMIGYVGVLPHPFFAVSGADGTFELPGLPPGDYTLEAWHERLGTRTTMVKIARDKPADVDGLEFTFSGK